MEMLTIPKTENLQPNYDIEMQVGGMTVAYHQNPDARRTEYTGNSTAVIDSGESGQKDSLGSFEMGETSVPVVAKFTVENKPDTYAQDAAPESEFLVVDIRGLGMSDAIGTSVNGFKVAADVGQRLGSKNDDGPQFALVNLTSIKRYSEGRGGMFSITTISRNPAEPTVIRRDHTMYGEATADSLSAVGLGESNITLSSDENGKIILSMDQGSNSPITVDATNDLLHEYEPHYAAAENDARTQRLYWDKKLIGESALHGLFTAETFRHYKAAYDQFGDTDVWLRARNSDLGNLNDDHLDLPQESANTTPTTADSPLQTVEDVYSRIADMRHANISDKEIKKTILKEVHPDFHPGIDPELAKVVTNEFRPRPQEYRNPETQTTPAEQGTEPASGAQQPASTEVVPASSVATESQTSADNFTQAA